jgi:hypothetical protein
LLQLKFHNLSKLFAQAYPQYYYKDRLSQFSYYDFQGMSVFLLVIIFSTPKVFKQSNNFPLLHIFRTYLKYQKCQHQKKMILTNNILTKLSRNNSYRSMCWKIYKYINIFFTLIKDTNHNSERISLCILVLIVNGILVFQSTTKTVSIVLTLFQREAKLPTVLVLLDMAFSV